MILAHTAKALALLLEAEEALRSAMLSERDYGDPEAEAIRRAHQKAYDLRQEVRRLVQEDY